MSKKKKKAQQKPAAKATPKAAPKKEPKVAPTKSRSSELSKSEIEAANFPFSKRNYWFMLIGIALIASGFLIMSMDTEEYGFGFLGLTLGPVITFVGFMFEIFAILYNGDNEND